MRRPSSEVYAPGETIPIDYLPPDLAPLPYGADAEDVEAVRTALYLNYGNVGLAAKALHTPAGQLARLVEQSPELRTDRDAARRMIVDRAEAVVVEQLSDEKNTDRRDEASKFVLTTLGKALGWGSQATAPNGFSMSDGVRTLQVKWQSD
jgi:hypothetical protein